jgi:hypothetical protein
MDDLHIGFLHANSTDGETLKLTTRKECNITVIDMAELCSESAPPRLE